MRFIALWIFFISIALISAMGLLMVYNTTAAEVLNRHLDGQLYQALIKQLVHACLGLIGAMVCFWIGYENMVRYSPFFLFLNMVLLLLVFVPGIGQQINGAHRWIYVFGSSFQPSELVKFVLPLFVLRFINKEGTHPRLAHFLMLTAWIGLCLGLILIEPDNGTVAILITALCTIFLLTKLKWTYWLLPLCIITAGGIVAAFQMKHTADRIRIYFHPEADLKGKGHQPYQAKIASGSGGLFGKGIGHSMQKLDYLPEARSDYIAAIFAEETGFMGIVLLILLYIAVALSGFYLAKMAPTPLAFHLIAIFTFLMTFQAFLNLGVVSGLLPSKGTNLPFFSHGGSSLIANILMLGLILNCVIKRGKEEKDFLKIGSAS